MEETKDTYNEHGWRIYTGTGKPSPEDVSFPDPPPWRTFTSSSEDPYMERILARGAEFQVGDKEIDLVNASLILRRPLLITGRPGSGKSSLAYSVARELRLGAVLRWPITSRTTLFDGLYYYDAIGRLQEANLQQKQAKQEDSSGQRYAKDAPDIGDYIHLGPLGNAFLPGKKPRVLLIDEIDKSDIDLPNDLLNIFEEGEFEIRELRRMARKGDMQTVEVFADKNTRVPIHEGRVRCDAFPFVVLTSNGEREFPPAFLRRCIQLEIGQPDSEKLLKIVEAHLGPDISSQANQLVGLFIEEREKGHLATDQLLNLAYFVTLGVDIHQQEVLRKAILHFISNPGTA